MSEEHSFKTTYYKNFLEALGLSNDFEATEKAYNFGVEKNIIKPTFYFPVVSSALQRNEIEKAVDWYCTKAEETNVMALWEVLGEKLINAENPNLLQKFINTFVKIKKENYTLGCLIYLFAKLNKEKEIQKLLDSKSFTLSRNSLELVTNLLLKNGAEEPFQCYLKATSGIPIIFKESIYKKLVMLHIKNKDLMKVKEVLLKMQEENLVLSLEFAQLVTNFYQDMGESFSDDIAKAESL